jgi:hypothetical protein
MWRCFLVGEIKISVSVSLVKNSHSPIHTDFIMLTRLQVSGFRASGRGSLYVRANVKAWSLAGSITFFRPATRNKNLRGVFGLTWSKLLPLLRNFYYSQMLNNTTQRTTHVHGDMPHMRIVHTSCVQCWRRDIFGIKNTLSVPVCTHKHTHTYTYTHIHAIRFTFTFTYFNFNQTTSTNDRRGARTLT